MKLTCTKNNLLESIGITQKAVSSKATVAVLEGFLLEAKGKNLKITGTDKDIFIESNVYCNVIKEGEIVIQAKMLSDIIKKLPDNQDVSLEVVTEEGVKEFSINAGEANFSIGCLEPSEFPVFTEPAIENKVTLNKNTFKKLIKSVAFACAHDETRPILQGISFKIENNKLTLCALDGYRLAVKNTEVNDIDDLCKVIPSKSISEILKSLDDDGEITLSFSKNHISLESREMKVSSKLLEGEFIKYENLIPKEFKTVVNINKDAIKKAIERVSTVLSQTTAITFDFTKQKLLVAVRDKKGKAKEKIPCNIEGEEVKIAFNPRYFLDALSAIDTDMVEIKLNSPLTPGVLQGVGRSDETYLVLPIRLAK